MAQGYHDSDVIFTEESLIGFIKSIHDNIGDNYHFVSTIVMAWKSIQQNPEFTEYELEIMNYYNGKREENNYEYWKTNYYGRICVINKEIEQGNGRYTWLKVGDQLEFSNLITDSEIKNSYKNKYDPNDQNLDIIPIGTFRVQRNYNNNILTDDWIWIKGFSNENFDNHTTNANPTSSLRTDKLWGRQLGVNNDPVKTAYINSLGTSAVPVTNAYITNLKLTSSFTSDGKLKILNDTEANRTVAAGVTATLASQLSGSIITLGGIAAGKKIMGERVYAAVFNDYAECRKTISLSPGHVVIDQDDGSLVCTSVRLQPGAQVISDTYGNLMGETNDCQTPIAVAGRVLVYPYQNRENYHAGMAVCSAPDGTVDIMTREEIRDYPDCIVGIVSEIPQYEKWGSNQVNVDGRIWIKVK